MCALIRLIIDLNRFLELSLYDEDTPANPWGRRASALRFLFCAELELPAPRFCTELELPAEERIPALFRQIIYWVETPLITSDQDRCLAGSITEESVTIKHLSVAPSV